MWHKLTGLVFGFLCVTQSFGQTTKFPTDPSQAKFVTQDICYFWQAFDLFLQDTLQNPFQKYYLDKGSQGVKDFMANRIESADKLYQTVKKHRKEYQKVRENTFKIALKEKECRVAFQKLKEWYPAATFPPVYFVIGTANSGGTSSKNGLIIGAEMQSNPSGIPAIVAHELIYFQQTFPPRETTLLEQSILEGSADFVGELISGRNINASAYTYGNAHAAELRKEFAHAMQGFNNQDWLYGVSGKDQRPKDLGYWLGYQICKAYFDKTPDKKKAMADILNIKDYAAFLKKSGYLLEK
ncbi:gliding motility protein GldB-related protein [Adhaeribacter pallidiroseus]|uniref:DUF2268 domain-containing protein n=1 Tax=Adhaeribacter pallidiroseus TaxID=2072847 RepID=A0A369QK68_9BACT|nr:DUF2268 domain-containing putative Zn-dependent protease [Adhaeribacter pallidiroseus]RDC64710.1 hypothetical protein AHMF7616_03326 [Adhaeribacter pallidiroseus]